MLNYIVESVPAFARTWQTVRKEVIWLKKTRSRLFSQPIDRAWVIRISGAERAVAD